MTDHQTLRQRIAQEAARLMWSGLASNFQNACRQAARQLTRDKLRRDQLPHANEIQAYLQQHFMEIANPLPVAGSRTVAESLSQTLHDLGELLGWESLTIDAAFIEAPLIEGCEIRLFCQLPGDQCEEQLRDAGYELVVMPALDEFVSNQTIIRFAQNWLFQLEIVCGVSLQLADIPEWDLREAVAYLEKTQSQPESLTAENPVDAPHSLAMAFQLLPLLSGVRINPQDHPEGDLFYHSLQVYQLGLDYAPYDAEFLEACLFHDLGYLQNYRYPQQGSVQLLKLIASEKTLFLIEELPEAHQYLKNGTIRDGLRKSQDFEELIELAKLDRKGRQPGADVPELEEVEAYLNAFEDENHEWDQDYTE
jgi:hypothetical protein